MYFDCNILVFDFMCFGYGKCYKENVGILDYIL